MKKHFWAGGAAAFIAPALLAGTTMPAWAQAAQPAGSTKLEEITVTASHRKENLQHTAIAVTAISGARLASSGVTTVAGLSKSVPGLEIATNGAGAQVYLRGVGTYTTDTYNQSPVAQNLDGIYLGVPEMDGGIFYDLARVEVLKGPQGTLYGKNATAGAINIITNQPGPDFGGYSTFEVGNYGLFKTEDAVNLPISDKVFVRLAGQFLNRDGYYSDHTGRTGGVSTRLQILIKPTDDISLTLGADYQHLTGQEEPLVVIGANPNNPWEGPTTAASNVGIVEARAPGAKNGIGLPPFFSENLPTIQDNTFGLRNDNAGVREDLEWNTDIANFTLLSSYRHQDTDWYTDPGFQDHETDIGHQYSSEFRVASPTGNGALKWQAGLYYFENRSNATLLTEQGFVQPGLNYAETDKAAAAFGEATYSVLPNLRITAGLRGTTETRGQTGAGVDEETPAALASFAKYLAGLGVPGFIIPFIVKSTFPPVNFSVANQATFRNLSVKGGVEYDVTPTSLAYASFNTGFKSGGLNNDLSTPAVSNVYKPETLDAYSIGSKNRFLDGTLQANGEGFYWTYKNHQEIYLTQSQADPAVTLPLTHNIGDAKIEGIDADLEYKATPNDLLTGSVEYLNSTFNNFSYNEYSSVGYHPNTGCATKALGKPVTVGGVPDQLFNVNCDGKPFTRAPHFAFNLSYQHIFDLPGNQGDVVALVDSQITTSQWLAIDYTPLEKEGDKHTTNLMVTYEPDNSFWTLSAYVRNIENTASYNSAFNYAFATNVTVGLINPPRTFGGILKMRF